MARLEGEDFPGGDGDLFPGLRVSSPAVRLLFHGEIANPVSLSRNFTPVAIRLPGFLFCCLKWPQLISSH
jgi:hypothetical protein